MIRADNFFRFEIEFFCKGFYQSVVVSKRAAFKNDWRFEFKALRKSADSLLNNCVKSRKRNILAGNALIQHRLNISFGKDTAAAGNRMNFVTGSCKRFEIFCRNFEKGSNFINKSTGTTSAASVHTHIRSYKAAVIVIKENDFCILAAKFNGSAGCWIKGTDSRRVCNNFLNVMSPDFICNRFSAGTAHSDSKTGIREFFRNYFQKRFCCIPLLSMMALVVIVTDFIFFSIKNNNFYSSRTNIDSHSQKFISQNITS